VVVADTQFLWTGRLNGIRLEVFGTSPETVSLTVVSATNGSVVRVMGTNGRVYALEESFDLDAWVTLGEQTCANGVALFVDPAVAPQRFYRAREVR
jgi:hypothetical protein